MSFISVEFLFLVLVTLGAYYARPLQNYQVLILVIASVVFYAWDQWQMLGLLAIAVIVTYRSMLGAIEGSRGSAAFGIVANLSLLAFFKYKFLVIPATSTFSSGNTLLDVLLQLPLPIGISFFVFHNISLIVDYAKRGRDASPPTPLQVVLYILFFPQLVSGPITRAISFIPQIQSKSIADVPWIQASRLVVTGLFFKLFCANNLAQATSLMSPELSGQLLGGDRLFLLFVYSFQIYADFFGYSTIALGLALLFGYRLPVNFRLPYIARSFADFWHRWHVSLSLWLRQYLYIPLGGNKLSPARTYVNLFIVMTLGGLWHGASLSYAVWGLAHGTLLAAERFWRQVLTRTAPSLRFPAWSRALYVSFVFVCVSLCWLLFRFQDFSTASVYVAAILADPIHTRLSNAWYLLTAVYMTPVLVQHALADRTNLISHPVLAGLLYGSLLWLAFAERGADTPFIYFRF